MNGADLRCAKLGGANLQNATIINANLSGANLKRANLKGANLLGATLREADFMETNLSGAKMKNANLMNANLREAILVKTILKGANITGCQVYGISAWDMELADAIQEELIITPDDGITIRVDNLELAQFVYLLLKYEKIRDVINTVAKKCVLILGRFDENGINILQSIASRLRIMDYLPMIFTFKRPDLKNFTETVNTLVGLSRFVVVDLSGPSVPQELYATVPHFKIPFVPIIEKSRKPYSMHVDLFEYPWFLKIVEFSNIDQLMELVPSKIVEPAEIMCKERQINLDRLFAAQIEKP